jgi:alanyl-tRNA synthetase
VLAIIKDDQAVEEAEAGDGELELVLDRTPFYAESGGQLADQGVIDSEQCSFQVQSVRKPVEKLIVHRGILKAGIVTVGDELAARIDSSRREASRRSHTATHLLQAALREILGQHVQQAGSLVGPDYLRFDFKHFQALTPEELAAVERRVNEAVTGDYPVEVEEMSQEEAIGRGATALFTEKYGDVVRVVSISDFSSELCGGTHAGRTGQLGLFKIATEGSVASGVRRLEAFTGKAAVAKMQEEAGQLRDLAQKLNAGPQEAPEKLDQILQKQQELSRRLESLEEKLMSWQGQSLAAQAEDCHGVKVVVAEVESDGVAALKLLADELRDRLQSGVAILGSRLEDKAIFLALVTEDLVRRGLHAGKLMREVAAVAGGGGGGRPDLAQAGGKEPAKLSQALERGRLEIEKMLQKD